MAFCSRRFSSSDPTLLRGSCVFTLVPLHLVHARGHGAGRRDAAAVVYYPNCIIALCLRGYNVSRCICHGAPRLVHGRSNGLIALSTQLRNCLQFTISRPDSRARTLLDDQFYKRATVYRRPFLGCLSLCINQRCRSRYKCVLIQSTRLNARHSQLALIVTFGRSFAPNNFFPTIRDSPERSVTSFPTGYRYIKHLVIIGKTLDRVKVNTKFLCHLASEFRRVRFLVIS